MCILTLVNVMSCVNELHVSDSTSGNSITDNLDISDQTDDMIAAVSGSKVDTMKVSSEWASFHYHDLSPAPAPKGQLCMDIRAATAATPASSSNEPVEQYSSAWAMLPPTYDQHYESLGISGNCTWPDSSGILEVR